MLLERLAVSPGPAAEGTGGEAAISRAALKAGRPVPVVATCAHACPRVVRNPTLRWLPSQNGLLADAPHLQSATRVSCLTSVWS